VRVLRIAPVSCVPSRFLPARPSPASRLRQLSGAWPPPEKFTGDLSVKQRVPSQRPGGTESGCLTTKPPRVPRGTLSSADFARLGTLGGLVVQIRPCWIVGTGSCTCPVPPPKTTPEGAISLVFPGEISCPVPLGGESATAKKRRHEVKPNQVIPTQPIGFLGVLVVTNLRSCPARPVPLV
jgi:hypothetical protein